MLAISHSRLKKVSIRKIRLATKSAERRPNAWDKPGSCRKDFPAQPVVFDRFRK